MFTWDERKRIRNLEKHGVDFTEVEDFEFENASLLRAAHHGETRWVAYGGIGGRLHCLVFTRRGKKIRIISLRKANTREVKSYG